MIVYHYTTAEKLNPIYADGRLLPSRIGIGPNEIPVLWFSANPMWEPTANKALGINGIGAVRPFTSAEMFQLFQLVRFGIDASKLLPWHQLRKAARIAHTEQRRLTKRAHKVSARPTDWFGSLTPIELRDVTREDLTPDRMWVPNVVDHLPFTLQETSP